MSTQAQGHRRAFRLGDEAASDRSFGCLLVLALTVLFWGSLAITLHALHADRWLLYIFASFAIFWVGLAVMCRTKKAGR